MFYVLQSPDIRHRDRHSAVQIRVYGELFTWWTGQQNILRLDVCMDHTPAVHAEHSSLQAPFRTIKICTTNVPNLQVLIVRS